MCLRRLISSFFSPTQKTQAEQEAEHLQRAIANAFEQGNFSTAESYRTRLMEVTAEITQARQATTIAAKRS